MIFENIHFRNIKGDIFGAVTSAVVALPLALAFGVASGLGPIAGLYGAIAVGFFAALLGGTPNQISGPTGPMTVAIVAIMATHASDLSETFAIVILSGLLQVLFGLFKLGRFVIYTPYSVISGFMSGIGFIIIIIETLPFFGLPVATGGPVGTIKAWPEAVSNLNPGALIVAILSLGICIFWPHAWRRILPPPLAALILGTSCSLLLFQNIPIIGEVPMGLPTLIWPAVEMHSIGKFLEPAIILALLGSIDSLLTSLVADSITRVYHDSDQELVGQGIGNMFAGLIGGLPGAGTTLGTVVNIRAGSQTPIAGATHALIILTLVLGLAPITQNIPLACLAGILMKVGIDIVDWRFLAQIHKTPKENVVIMGVTFILAVFVDLVTAVAVGLIVSSFVSAHRARHEELSGLIMVPLLDMEVLDEEEISEEMQYEARSGMLSLSGRFSVASSRDLARLAGTDLETHQIVIFDFSEVAYMDDSASLVIGELIAKTNDRGDCVIVGLSGIKARMLRALVDLSDIPREHFVDNLDTAKKLVGNLLRQADQNL